MSHRNSGVDEFISSSLESDATSLRPIDAQACLRILLPYGFYLISSRKRNYIGFWISLLAAICLLFLMGTYVWHMVNLILKEIMLSGASLSLHLAVGFFAAAISLHLLLLASFAFFHKKWESLSSKAAGFTLAVLSVFLTCFLIASDICSGRLIRRNALNTLWVAYVLYYLVGTFCFWRMRSEKKKSNETEDPNKFQLNIINPSNSLPTANGTENPFSDASEVVYVLHPNNTDHLAAISKAAGGKNCTINQSGAQYLFNVNSTHIAELVVHGADKEVPIKAGWKSYTIHNNKDQPLFYLNCVEGIEIDYPQHAYIPHMSGDYDQTSHIWIKDVDRNFVLKIDPPAGDQFFFIRRSNKRTSVGYSALPTSSTEVTAPTEQCTPQAPFDVV